MEQAVLGIFQEQLAKVIVGFRKEQVNANLLNGKGEIRDVSLNCSFLNEKIATVTPFIELEEIHVSRLGFHVTSWTNLRKAPIIVDIGHITAKVQEPLQVLPRHRRRKLEMVTEAELIHKMIAEGFKPLRGSGSYGLVDRIVDNMTIEMESFTLEYQTWGKFKTRRMGQWTPPALQVRFENLKVVMVDEEGNEASPDQVWQHNQRQREHFMIYKKVCGECQVRLCPNSGNSKDDDENRDNQQASSENKSKPFSSSIKLAETKMEVQMAIQRRLRDGAVLAVQMDVTLPRFDVQVDSKGVHELAHFAAGLQYCLAKDRSFEDPLRHKSEDIDHTNKLAPLGPTVRMMSRADTADEDDNVNETSGNRNRADTTDSAAETSSVGNTSGDFDGASVSSWQSDEEASMSKDASSHGRPVKGAMAKQGSSRPVIILPNGLVVYKSITITCAVHDFSFRGFYPGDTPARAEEDNGYIEFNAKGCITELLWPKVDRDPGLYVQLSTSFVTLQERYDGRKRTVLLGGMQRDDHLSLLLPSRKPLEIGADEFFPLFERRGIREDPLDLRHLFPTQAVGVKSTIDIFKEKCTIDSLGPDEFETKYKVLHEMGLDEMDIVLDTDIFHRVTRFFLNQDGEGFDPRWQTGDWTELLTPEMLHHPNEVLDLDECLQEPKQIFLDENYMISSYLFNVTARLTNVEVKIPAAVQDNLRSCDIALKWKETTLVVSSALPRTFLSGRIGNSIAGDARKDSEKNVIDFPNDPSDICYSLDKTGVELPPVESEGSTVSTFRSQVTVRGFEMTFIPIIPFCKAIEPQRIISISNSTIIFSFEGEPPTDDSNQIKITMFVSILVHDLAINLDLDLLTGAIYTILHHKDKMVLIIHTTSTLFPPSPTNSAATASNLERIESVDSLGIKKNLKGRKILVQRHISRSRETGGLSIVFCMQQHNMSLRLWRQNIPLRSPLRHLKDYLDGDAQFEDGGLIDTLNLVDYSMKEFEFGVEFDFHVNSGRRTVVKCCLDKASFKICNVEKGLAGMEKEKYLIDLCAFGDAEMPGGWQLSGNGQQVAFRIEGQHERNSQSWSVAGDITSPSRMHLHADAVKSVALQILEALLLPSWSKENRSFVESCPFPSGTVGSLFHELVSPSGDRGSALSVDFSKLDLEDSSDAIVERILKAVSKLVFPSDLHVILLRWEVANVLVSIPSVVEEEATKSLCLLIHQADVITRFYPFGGENPSKIENVLACKGTDWSTLINTDKKGLYLRLESGQSLLSFLEDSATDVETVVHPFELNFTYACSKVDVEMSRGFRIDDIRQIEAFQSRLKSALVLSRNCLSDISFVTKTMKWQGEEERLAYGNSTSVNGSDFMEEEFSFSSTACLQKSRALLKRASEELLFYEEEVRAAMRRRDDELEAMKLRLFLKERERFGAVALLASRVAGWVRMGGMHRTGQRVARKSLLWPYWAVLRKELLIVYPSPGVNKPFDIVSLVNARIRRLAGGKSKHDIKRGFAIIESSGMTRYFVARDAQEFTLWTREISETIRACSDPAFLAEIDNVVLNGSESETFGDDTGEEDDISASAQRKLGFGNRLASSIQSAKQKARDFSERRGRASSNDSLENVDDEDSEQTRDRVVSFDNGSEDKDTDLPSKRAVIGKKLSGVGQATKSRFGNVIQSARQKGAEISNRRRRNENESNGSLHGNESPSDTIEDSLAASSDGHPPRRRLQLGNKLGSAIQQAKAGGLTGFRSKLGGTAPGRQDIVEDLSGSNDSSGQETSDVGIQSFWTCDVCTFINRRGDSCEVCGNERRTNMVEILPAESTSLSPATGDLADAAEVERNGMLGTADLAVNEEQRLLRRSTSIEQNSNRRNSRFGFRRPQEETVDDSAFGGNSVALKNVYVSNETPTSEEPQNQMPVPLKRLQGTWNVLVKPTQLHMERKFAPNAENAPTQTNDDCDPTFTGNSDQTTGSLEKRDVVGLEIAAGIPDIPSKSNASELIPSFDVRIFRGASDFGSPEVEKRLTLGDVAHLFTDISETVEGALPQLIDNRCYEDAQKQEQQYTVERLLIYGRILGGLLEDDDRAEVQKYQCEAIEGFLNALLECPLPVNALLSLSETLGISASTVDAPGPFLPASSDTVPTNTTKPLSKERPTAILSLLYACQSELQRIENEKAIEMGRFEKTVKSRKSHNDCSSTSAHQASPERQTTTRVCFDPILPPSLTTTLHDSIHDALMSVMAERDEAHAQLIGANVLHIHSLERERKKNEKLAAEIKMREEVAKIQARQDLNQPNLASFFGGKPDDRMAKMRQEIDLKMEAFHQVHRNHASTEEEMTQLCSQLANEISSKTSHALEVERLKKVKETEVDERRSLQEELKRVKELLAAEERKRTEAEKDARKWKTMYESSTTPGGG